ncbi:hypothetical protein JTB14_004954, partial [Gonioctena quinquepunctata]
DMYFVYGPADRNAREAKQDQFRPTEPTKPEK